MRTQQVAIRRLVAPQSEFHCWRVTAPGLARISTSSSLRQAGYRCSTWLPRWASRVARSSTRVAHLQALARVAALRTQQQRFQPHLQLGQGERLGQ
jgi:hypothetical protein